MYYGITLQTMPCADGTTRTWVTVNAQAELGTIDHMVMVYQGTIGTGSRQPNESQLRLWTQQVLRVVLAQMEDHYVEELRTDTVGLPIDAATRFGDTPA